MVSRDDARPGARPVSVPNVRVMADSELPKSAGSIRAPADIKGEAPPPAAVATLAHDRSLDPSGNRSRIRRRNPGLSELAAMPPSTVPIEVCIPRETEVSDSPNDPAIPARLRLSSVLQRSVNIDISAIPFFPISGHAALVILMTVKRS